MEIAASTFDLNRMPSGLSIVTAVSDLDLRLPEWDELFARCGQAAPFCGPRVWVPWLKTFPQHRPAIFELRRDGRLCALLPMYRNGDRLGMATGPHLDYQDLIAEDHESAVEVLLAAIEGGHGPLPSQLDFPNVQAGSRLESALADPRVGDVSHVQSRFMTFCMVTEFKLRKGESFLASLSGRHRRNFRNASRRIEKAAPAHVIEHRGPGELSTEVVAEAAGLHIANQHRKEGPSIFSVPGFRDFVTAQASAGAPIVLSLLRESPGGPLMAFNLGYFANDTYYFYLTSYAGRHAGCSPGRWILADSLRHWSQSVCGDVLRFDLLGGEEDYKERWAHGRYTVSRAVVIPRGVRHLPQFLAYSAVYGLKTFKNRLLGRGDVRGVTVGEPDVAGLPR